MPIVKLGPDETVVSCGTGDVCLSLGKGDDRPFPTAVLFHPAGGPHPVGSDAPEYKGVASLETRLPRVHPQFGSRASLEVVIRQLRSLLDGRPADPAAPGIGGRVMALTIDPGTGQATTTFLLCQKERDRVRDEARAATDRRLLDDALSWRMLPDRVKARLLKKYGGKA